MPSNIARDEAEADDESSGWPGGAWIGAGTAATSRNRRGAERYEPPALAGSAGPGPRGRRAGACDQ